MRTISKTFLSHLVSYALLLLLPFLVVSSFSHYLIYNEISQYEENQTLSTMDNIVTESDHALNNILRSVHQLTLIKDFRTVSLNDPISYQNICTYLLNFKTVLPQIKEIVFYNKNTPRFYTSKGTISTLYSSAWEEENFPNLNKPFLDTILEIEKSTLFSNMDHTELFLCYPFEKQKEGFVSYMVVVLDRAFYDALLNNKTQSNLATSLLTANSDTLFSLNKPSITGKITHIQKPSTCTELQFQYDFSISSATALLNIQKIQSAYFIITMIVFLLGCFLIYLAMRKNYAPIKKLANDILPYEAETETETKKDDIKRVSEAITRLATENQYTKSVNEQLKQDDLIHSILIDSAFSPVVEEHTFSALPNLGTGMFTLILYPWEKTLTVNQSKMIQNAVLPTDPELTALYATAKASAHILTFILTSSAPVKQTTLNTLYNTLTLMTGKQQKCVFSKDHTAWSEISPLYLKTKKSYYLSSLEEMTPAQNALLHYPSDELKRLAKYVSSGRIEDVKSTTEEILAISACLNSEIQSLHICFEIINCLNSNKLFAFNMEKMQKANEKPALEQLFTLILEHVKCVKKEDETSNSFIDEVVEFIQAHFCDYDFSVNHLADCFHVSVSTLSKKFKTTTNQSLLNYVTDLKIQKAKQMLENTKLPVSDISNLLGYAQSSGFIRKFKEEVGVTPQQFRQQQ